MKRKLIVTLVAAALELYAATAGAQATCDLTGTATTASGATQVTTGPLNPVDGFPEYVTDSTGVALQRCLDPLVCFFDPIVPTDPFSLQIGSGGEAFYWGADAILADTTGKAVLKLVMAAETAFLQAGPNGEPINGSQFPFLRMRVVLDAPADGIYTLVHPYGTEKFEVVGATGNRDVFFTVDSGFAPNSTVTGKVGPFLKSVNAPAGFMGDANGVPDLVTGSPCGRNTVELTGVSPTGQQIDFGGGQTVLFTDAFTVQGRLYDGVVQTPINASRLTYSRSAAGAGQIDAFGASTPTATMTVQDGPTIPAGSSRIATAVTLDRTATSLTEAVDSTSVVVADASVVPPILQLSAVSPTTDTTALNLKLVDFVDITQADYDPATGTLSVSAASGDQRLAPTLTLRDFGAFAAGSAIKTITTVAPPAVVHVDSAAGGTATAQVRVITSAPPTAPTGLVSTGATARTVTLNWTDTSTNENGFTIYSVAADGTRTIVGSTGQNTTGVTISGLTPSTSYTFQVDAVNGAGAASSNTVVASTVALPVAPASATSALSTSAIRTINVGWADSATDETGYQVYRRAGTGAYVAIGGVLPAGSTSFSDSTAATGTTYTYQVVALRGTEASSPTTTTSLTTPTTTPTSAGTVTQSALSATQVRVSWTDRTTTEFALNGYKVWRAPVTLNTNGTIRTVGTFTLVSGDLQANSTSYTDTTAAPSTSYVYRVDVTNWVATAQAQAAAAVTTPALVLAAPGSLAATSAAQPALTWTDTNSFETGYRVSRRAVTFSNAGAVTNGALGTLTNAAADATTYTDGTATLNSLVQYSVSALNGTTVGAASTVYAVPGGIPTPAAPSWTRAASTVTISWTQPGATAAERAAIGGYRVERCTVSATETCTGTTGWTLVRNVAGRNSLSTTQNVAANNPARTYYYRVTATTGSVTTGIESAASARSTALVR